jgi:threonine/homoserine/homoserine lactone efflux protein
MELFTQGLIFGLAIAAPVGPIGVLTIRRTLVGGLLLGLLSGLGAATADGIYGTVAALGLTAVSDFLVRQQTWLQLIGGLFLLYLGIQTIRSKPVNSKQYSVNSKPAPDNSIDNLQLTIDNSQLTFFRAYASTLFLTLSNPVTILSFTAVFAGFGLGSQASETGSDITLVAGVFLGSALWWLILTGVVTAVRGKLNARSFRLINIASGLILVGFALALLVRLLLTL